MRSSITSKRSKNLFILSVSGLLLVYAGCGGETASPGAVNSGAGTTATAGTAGTAGSGGAGGSAGVSGGAGGVVAGGTGGVAGGAGGAAGGAGGVAPGGAGGAAGGVGGGGGGGAAGMDVGLPCSTMAGTVDGGLNLTVLRPEIGVRAVADNPAGDMMKIEYDKATQTIFMVNQGGNIWTLDPVGNSVAPANTGFGGGSSCRGLAFDSVGTMYVQCGGFSVDISKGTPDGNGGYTWSTLVTSASYPPPPGNAANFGHLFSGLRVSPDDQYVFFGSGSRTDHGEDGGGREAPLSSAIFRVPATGVASQLPNDEAGLTDYLFADGLRNPFDFNFNALGDLIAADNGPDMDLPDEINFVEQGKHYGFPWRMGDVDNPTIDAAYTANGDMRLHAGYQANDNNLYNADPNFPAAPGAFTDPIPNSGPDSDKFSVGPTGGPMDASDAAMALAGITPHKSPLGVNFDVAGELCGDYYKAGFFATFGAVGDFFGDGGKDLNLIKLTKVGATYQMNIHQLVAGFQNNIIDTAMVGNKIYVMEYFQGRIYEITLPVAQ